MKIRHFNQFRFRTFHRWQVWSRSYIINLINKLHRVEDSFYFTLLSHIKSLLFITLIPLLLSSFPRHLLSRAAQAWGKKRPWSLSGRVKSIQFERLRNWVGNELACWMRWGENRRGVEQHVRWGLTIGCSYGTQHFGESWSKKGLRLIIGKATQ